MSSLFSPLQIRSIHFRNRIGVSPMCQYSAEEGIPGDWHLVHLGSRAVGGAGLTIVEASSVSPEGRITPEDLGLWDDSQIDSFRRITTFINEQGCLPGIQLAHAGKKASTFSAWKGSGWIPLAQGGWRPIGPDERPFDSSLATPMAMSAELIHETADLFAKSAQRSVVAGFRFIEIHMAHGYLLHSFLSPLMNQRKDEWGGSLKNRMRFPLLVAEKVRRNMPDELPLFVRISATDWTEGGWDEKESVELCGRLKELGVDLIDCSSGGAVPNARIPVAPGYQVKFSSLIKKETGLRTAAVGFITEARQAEEIVAKELADVVLLGREMLRNPYWPMQAARELNATIDWPVQYLRAK